MKFENVKKLVDQLDFESQGYLEVGNPSGLKKQFGAFRTKCVFFFFSSKPDLMLTIPPSLFFFSCIDCLDRTNGRIILLLSPAGFPLHRAFAHLTYRLFPSLVVQSALARHVLSLQLASLNLGYPKAIPGSTPSTQKTELELIFNDVWANNGDAISRAYAGTSALKGDFTRYV
jgi:hypothetical protein